jgi:hypothetical protein
MPAQIETPVDPENNRTATIAEDIADPVGSTELRPNVGGYASTDVWDRREQIVRILAAIAVSFSAILAAWQFWESKLDEKRERSLAILNQWQAGPEREAYRRLAEAVTTTIGETGPLPSGLAPEAYSLAVNGLGNMTMDRLASGGVGYDGDWRVDVDALVDFYSTMEFCMNAGLCDDAILRTYFAPSVTSFWGYFAPFAETKRRQHYPQYGVEIDKLIERFTDE